MTKRLVQVGIPAAWVLIVLWIVVIRPPGLELAWLWTGIFLLVVLVTLEGLWDAIRLRKHARAERPLTEIEEKIATSHIRRDAVRAISSLALLVVGLASLIPLTVVIVPAFFAAALGILGNSLMDRIDRHELLKR